ncbi:MAG TPA: radical SAM/SPASM family putative metalloenzyme maturase [Desulfuromonadales bacterium]|nr:radical SAM/SPASM family putative metalloenzyme maturase [Desulfuromonadales bacterium]
MSTNNQNSSNHITARSAAVRPYPTKLFVETSSRCNLNCAMCVKQHQASHIIDGDLSPEVFMALLPALPTLESLILNGVGEPLLNPHMETFIRTAKELMPPHGWIGFQTNGLLMTEQRAVTLVKAGLDRVCVSVDAIVPETFTAVREGGSVEGVERALAALVQARSQCERPDVRIGIEFVAMRSTITQLPGTLEWASRRGVDFAIVTHMLPYDQKNADEALYSTISDKAYEIFRTWLEKATQAGLDLNDYIATLKKYTRTPEELAVVAMIKAMKTEAAEQNVMLDVLKLIQHDRMQSDHIREIFEEAQEVAARTGLELRLPEIALKEHRSCSFVEEGSAFVSWNGDISPCYFLWHSYECFASGWQQQVKPTTFGNLADNDIREIWNSPQFIEFRRNVLDYDYPSCASCGLAPCDYVQTDQFEQDCHVRTVPCGACLWCTGVFQCLR